MTVGALKSLLEAHFQDGEVEVSDMTGTSDHFEVEITSAAFAGKSLIDQHRLVHQALREHLTTSIHALKIKTHVRG